MDEDIAIIDKNTRNEKIKNFLINYKKVIISSILIIIILLISYFVFDQYKEKKKKEISDLYNTIIIEYSQDDKAKTLTKLIELINKKDSTYSPLSLYFIIDKKLLLDQSKINELFDVVIEEASLDKEIKNLIIYKKGLYNADNSDENQLLSILNPVINSDGVWKAHALYLMAEYFYAKDEKQKSKEFFNRIISLENVNEDLKLKAQKILNRDLSE